MRRLGPTIVGSVFIAGCVAIGAASWVVSSRPGAIARQDLVGTYEVTLPFGRSSLRLNGDGRYTQEIEVGGERASANGVWTYESKAW